MTILSLARSRSQKFAIKYIFPKEILLLFLPLVVIFDEANCEGRFTIGKIEQWFPMHQHLLLDKDIFVC